MPNQYVVKLEIYRRETGVGVDMSQDVKRLNSGLHANIMRKVVSWRTGTG